MSSLERELLAQLGRAQRLGFLGPGPVADHVRHGDAFVAAVGPTLPSQALDLGSGGGVPGLILAIRWPTAAWLLLDSSERRTTFLRDAVESLDLGDRVEVVTAAAEVVARDPRHRAMFDLVVARGFGSPPVVAECGAPFLRPGGRLLVSEPPVEAPDRWPRLGLERFGLRDQGVVRSDAGSVRVLRQAVEAPADVPRGPGIPARRPRW